MVDEAPKAKYYFSDALKAYGCLWYHYRRYQVSDGKSDTYSVEGDNSELRRYLAQIAWFLALSMRFAVCLEVICLRFQQ